MKLCKDCAHARMPNPAYWGPPPYYHTPMCAHPDAPRDRVYGALRTTCAAARDPLGLHDQSICGPDAELWVARPVPAPAPDAGSFVYVETPEPRRSWINRILGW